jgi:DNA-binding NtrC family response regulator
MPHPIVDWIVEHSDRAVRPLREVEKEYILHAMILCRGNVRLAAQGLGLNPRTLYYRLKRYRQEDSHSPS